MPKSQSGQSAFAAAHSRCKRQRIQHRGLGGRHAEPMRKMAPRYKPEADEGHKQHRCKPVHPPLQPCRPVQHVQPQRKRHPGCQQPGTMSSARTTSRLTARPPQYPTLHRTSRALMSVASGLNRELFLGATLLQERCQPARRQTPPVQVSPLGPLCFGCHRHASALALGAPGRMHSWMVDLVRPLAGAETACKSLMVMPKASILARISCTVCRIPWHGYRSLFCSFWIWADNQRDYSRRDTLEISMGNSRRMITLRT